MEHFADWPVRPNSGHFLGGCHWYGLETMYAMLTFAAAYGAPEYDPRVATVPKDRLGDVALKALRYLCFTHDAGPADCVRPASGIGRPETWGTKWGERGKGFFRESQCGVTIAGMAMTAAVLGDRVDDETTRMLATVCRDYAERFAGMSPKRGVYIDTQMEENAWTGLGLAAAALVLGKTPLGAQSAKAAQRWVFAAATVPQDTKNRAAFFDGETVAGLTGKNITALPDYMAENHGIVHPSYTASPVNMMSHLAVLYRLYGRELPPHALFNRDRVYERIKHMTDAGGYVHPPQGMDWPYHWVDPGTLLHSGIAVLFSDADAAALARRALRTLETRQAGSGGRMLDRELAERVHDIQDPMLVRESTFIGRAAYGCLFHRLYGDGPAPTPEPELEERLRGVRVFPHAGFLFHRHTRGHTSVSWRNSIMMLPVTSDGILTIAPATDSVFARINVDEKPDSHELQFVHVDRHSHSAACAFVVRRAQASIRQEALSATLPDGRSLCLEQIWAREAVTVRSVEQGLLRVTNERFPAVGENNIGSRSFTTPGGTERFEGFVSTDPESDVVRTYNRPGWVNVDDRLGIVFSGTGTTVYHNRHYFEPWWATADDLVLSRSTSPTHYEAGARIAFLCALFVPDQDARETAITAAAAPVVLQGEPGHVGVLIDGWLAAANLTDTGGRLRFVVARGNGWADQAFPGTVTLNDSEWVYELVLAPRSSVLLRRVGTVAGMDRGTLLVGSGGDMAVQNDGTAPAAVRRDEAADTRAVPGGETVYIRCPRSVDLERSDHAWKPT